MHKFKQFMDEELFTELTSAAMRSHMNKPEVVSILRALAIKYSELGEHEKALKYIERATEKCDKFNINQNSTEMLQIDLSKIEILKKKNRTDCEHINMEICKLA